MRCEGIVPGQIQDQPFLSGPARRVGVLGGTFNPVHNGHLDIARQAMREFTLDEVLLMVASDPPHKLARSDMAPREMRYKMAALACEGEPRISPSPLELMREGRSYTVDTMRELREGNPRAEFLFIIGEDTLYLLESWHEAASLFRETEFICLMRPVANTLVPPAVEAKRLAEKYGAVIYLSDYMGPNISSTYIRECVKTGRSIAGLTPRAVEEYIYETGLYK